MKTYIVYISGCEDDWCLAEKEKAERSSIEKEVKKLKELTYSINENGDVVQNFSEKELLEHIRNGGGLPKLPKVEFKHNRFYFVQE